MPRAVWVALSLGLSSPCHALEAGDTEVLIEAEVSTHYRYLWRGLALGDEPALQLWAGASAWGVSLWSGFNAALSTDVEDPVTEVWIGLDYEYELEPVTFLTSLQAWIYPGDTAASTMEVQLSVAWNIAGSPVQLVTHHTLDVVSQPGAWYGDLGLAASVEVTEWLVVEGQWVHAFANGLFNELNVGTEGASVHMTGGELRLGFAVGAGLSIVPQAAMAFLLDSEAREALETGFNWTAGLAVAGEW